MGKVLSEKFFNRDTTIVAQELLGKFLVRNMGNKKISAMICETEAYDGFGDLASHASKGHRLRRGPVQGREKTRQSDIMFGQPGNFYVYLIYGMYYMLNVVTREHGYPAAVLIRAIALSDGAHLNGPGKLTRFFKINKNLNGQPAKKSANLWFEDRGVIVSKNNIKKLTRIGVNYAGPVWAAKKWRFILEI